MMKINKKEKIIQDKDKVLFAKLLLKITFIMICISVSLKLLGLNIFEIENNNKILLYISSFIGKYDLKWEMSFLLLFLQTFIIFRLSCKNPKIKIYYFAAFIATIITIFSQIFIFIILGLKEALLGELLYFLFSFFIIVFTPVIIDIKIKDNKIINKPLPVKILIKIWKRIKKPIAIFIIIFLYQFLVMFIRNITYVDKFEILYNFLLNFDYIILLLATYYLFLKKESKLVLEADAFSLAKILNERPTINDIKTMILVFKGKITKFKKSSRTDKIVLVVYLFFFFLSEIINVGIIIYIATLNHFLIECLFIIVAFLISKKIFGAFHFNSAIKCWLVSNISFYLLSRITVNTKISFVIPIILGIALSLLTSKFIKKNNKTLYRGISEKDLLDISKDKNLTTLEFEILKKYYCEGLNMKKLTFIYHYSLAQLYRFKSAGEKKLV